MAIRNGIFSPSLSWKGNILGLDIVSQNVPYIEKQITEPKIADLGIIFLRRSYLIHRYQLLHPLIVGSIPFRFFLGHLALYIQSKSEINVGAKMHVPKFELTLISA